MSGKEQCQKTLTGTVNVVKLAERSLRIPAIHSSNLASAFSFNIVQIFIKDEIKV